MLFPFGRKTLPGAGELFDRHGAMVYRRCRELLGTDELARDAVQGVFLRVVERRDTFRGDAPVTAWLHAIATLYCLQQLRNRARRDAKLEAEGAARSERNDSPLDDRLTVAALLEREDDEVRQMVVLRHVDGMTVEEVGAVVGRSRKTVAKKLDAFLASARARLAAASGGDR